MLRRRVLAVLNGCNVGLYCCERRIVALLKILNETRRTPLCDIEDVVQDQYLAVDIRASTNTDDGHIEFFSRSLANFVWHALKQDNIGARVLQSLGSHDHLPSFVGIPALHLETAYLVH